MTESEIKAYIASEVTAQLQAITSKDIASESDVPTLSDAEWDSNNSITSLPVVYNGNAWRKIGAGFLRTLRNAAAVVSTAWNALKNNGTSVSWIPTVDTSGNAGKTSPADLAAVLGVNPIHVIESTNWVRIARVNEYTSGLIFCTDGYNIHPGGAYIIAFCKSYQVFTAKYIIKTIASEEQHEDEIRLNQLRIVKSDGVYYLEGKRINNNGTTSLKTFGLGVFDTPTNDSPGGTVVTEITISE